MITLKILIIIFFFLPQAQKIIWVAHKLTGSVRNRNQRKNIFRPRLFMKESGSVWVPFWPEPSKLLQSPHQWNKLENDKKMLCVRLRLRLCICKNVQYTTIHWETIAWKCTNRCTRVPYATNNQYSHKNPRPRMLYLPELQECTLNT